MMDDTIYRSASVCIDGHPAGTIMESDDGYIFKYTADYLNTPDAIPVSLTLPLTAESYTSKTLFSFFDGLIPEGWLLDVVRSHWNIPENDRFGILISACRDCVGDVEIIKEGAAL